MRRKKYGFVESPQGQAKMRIWSRVPIRTGKGEDANFQIKRRDVSWTFILIFLIGAIFGGLICDPVSDTIFFLRNSTGIPLAPAEQVFYWYYLSTIVYVVLFAISFLIMRMKKVSAKNFRIALVIFVMTSFVYSIYTLGFDLVVILMLIIPELSFMLVMFYVIRVKVKNEYVEI